MLVLPRPAATLRIMLIALAATSLAGCASRAGYPSLAPRPIEDISLAEPVSRPRPAGVSPAEAASRYAPLLAAVQDSDAIFEKALAEARPVLVRGREAPLGSDAWGDAQQAYSRVAARRGDVAQAVSALQAAGETPEAQDDPALAAAAAQALEQARGIDAGEAATLKDLAPRAS